jgi:hypothetical protein
MRTPPISLTMHEFNVYTNQQPNQKPKQEADTMRDQDAHDAIARAFKWHQMVPPLQRLSSFAEIARRAPQHYYTKDTRQFFGTRNPHVAAPGFTVELHSKAPEGVPRYPVTAWISWPETPHQLNPVTIHWAHTRDEAHRVARRLAKVWDSVTITNETTP